MISINTIRDMPRSAVGNESDCRSRGSQLYPCQEIDHEIISIVILLLKSTDSNKVFVSYKQKYVHKVLINILVKLALEKVLLGELSYLLTGT